MADYSSIKATRSFEDFVELVNILRKECPWDKKQTHDSIKDNLIEEAYEAVDAIEKREFVELKKELGDLMLHVIFQTKMANENEHFDIGDVIYAIQEKLIRRHPHIFADTQVEGTDEVLQNWEQIKMKEGKKSVLDGLPIHLPALIKAHRMQEKAANVGFDWPEFKEVWAKLKEEIDELDEAIEKNDQTEITKEFGDVFFSMVNVARVKGIASEDALRLTNTKFENRFRFIEEKIKEEGKELKECTLEEMDLHWNKSKTLFP